jgi:hypothetical protein
MSTQSPRLERGHGLLSYLETFGRVYHKSPMYRTLSVPLFEICLVLVNFLGSPTPERELSRLQDSMYRTLQYLSYSEISLVVVIVISMCNLPVLPHIS